MAFGPQVGPEEVGSVDVGLGSDFQGKVGWIYIALLNRWLKGLGNS